jgi:hypothetical protein
MIRKPQISLASLLALMLIASLLIAWVTAVWRREQQAIREPKQRQIDAAAKWVDRIEADPP